MNGSAAAVKVYPRFTRLRGAQECCAWQDLILCRMDTSDCDLITLTEVSELGLTYTYKADAVKGKKWANLRSWSAVS